MPLNITQNTSKIFLVGMPGCGKSSVGKVLAERLGYAFLDLDTLVEERENLLVAQIFELHGQEYFRKAEAQALRSVQNQKDGMVLATGGGAPCFHGNMAFMVQHGVTVYLQVSPEALVSRLTAMDLQVRPLLRDKTSEALLCYLSETLAGREAFYQQAVITVAAGTLSVDAAALVLAQRINTGF